MKAAKLGKKSTFETIAPAKIRRLATGTCKTQKQYAPNDDTGTPSSQNYKAISNRHLQNTKTTRTERWHRNAFEPELRMGTIPTMIRPWPETVSHTSFRKAWSSSFRDNKSTKKHTISCKSYLSKTHFVRDLLQKCNLKLCKRKHLCETSFKNQTSWTSRDTVVAAMLLWFVTSSDSLLEVILYWSGSLLEVILYWSDSLLDLILYWNDSLLEVNLYLKRSSTEVILYLKWFSTWSEVIRSFLQCP